MSKPLDNPLSEPEISPHSSGPEDNDSLLTEGELPGIVRGRMFCLMHGRECYRRISITGESEWVCPDERHGKPIRS